LKRLPNLSYHDLAPDLECLQSVVLDGLAQDQKRLPPKLLYDRAGSILFEAITRLPEYYPTRTEIGLLCRHGKEIAALLGTGGLVIELGSGSDVKIRTLLEALRPSVYMPVDISGSHLFQAATKLAEDYPWLRVQAVCADYTQPLALPMPPDLPRTAFFPGSSIGNFEPAEARSLLTTIARVLGPDGHLLIGVDMKKNPAMLHAAYNDSQGVTAAFNMNLLTRINRELGGDFDPGAFKHCAFYNARRARIEMHLVARAAQQVRINGRHFAFASGESIHTENSYKFSIAQFQALTNAAGYAAARVWHDAGGMFSIHCLRVACAG
jgi:dimethylhistidine N-methyltransferase